MKRKTNKGKEIAELIIKSMLAAAVLAGAMWLIVVMFDKCLDYHQGDIFYCVLSQ